MQISIPPSQLHPQRWLQTVVWLHHLCPPKFLTNMVSSHWILVESHITLHTHTHTHTSNYCLKFTLQMPTNALTNIKSDEICNIFLSSTEAVIWTKLLLKFFALHILRLSITNEHFVQQKTFETCNEIYSVRHTRYSTRYILCWQNDSLRCTNIKKSSSHLKILGTSRVT